jgi:hypothetical protein
MVPGWESANVSYFAQDSGRNQGADPGDRCEIGSAGLNHLRDLQLQLGDIDVEPAKGLEPSPRQTRPS